MRTERGHLEFVEWRDVTLRHATKWPSKLWEKPRWWLVRLLGGQCPFDTAEVVRVPVCGKTFMDRLWKQKRELVENFGREPTTLWIGGEDYQKLMHSRPAKQQFNVHAEFNYGRHEVYGLTVRVIPWMRGFLVMPSDCA